MTDGLPGKEKAMEIYQDFLDQITDAYMKRDFDAYAQLIRVPHDLGSFGPRLEVRNHKELRFLFDSICDHLFSESGKHYVRTCLTAEFVHPNKIVGVHETRVVAGGLIKDGPYPVKGIMRRIDGQWWVCGSDNAIEPDDGMGRVILTNARSKDELSGKTVH